MGELEEKQAALKELSTRVAGCSDCALHAGRTNPVFGDGSAEARIMFVGEAPGYHEDRLGIPFVGQAGKLLDRLLAGIGLARPDIYIANVLKCRPPNNRDPQPQEIERCRAFLEAQIGIIRPDAICTMGNFSTKLLSGRPDGISRVRGRMQPYPGSDDVQLFPVFHPAAALYTPANLKMLEGDFDTLAHLLHLPVASGGNEDGKSQAAPQPSVQDGAAPEDIPEAQPQPFGPPPGQPAGMPQVAPEAPHEPENGQLGLF